MALGPAAADREAWRHRAPVMEGPSNFRQAVQALRENLRCPACGAVNRPGATYIELQANGLAVCTVCAKTFQPSRDV